jgi:DNA-binding Xre family transcriptional regulator|tara:strand:- start:2523 stop:2744 length:222 start_codon:yes stop_codon:yes gene_type:complete
MATIEIQVTKINKILIERGLTQTDLFELIKSNGNSIGKDRINRIVNGKLTNYHTNTAKILAQALGVSLDDIVD